MSQLELDDLPAPVFYSYSQVALDIAIMAGHFAQAARLIETIGDYAPGEADIRQLIPVLRDILDQLEERMRENPLAEHGRTAYDVWPNRSAPDPDFPGGKAA